MTVAVAGLVFAGGLTWTASQLLGSTGSGAPPPSVVAGTSTQASPPAEPAADPAAVGRAFLAAWARRDYAGMQALVLDQGDDMNRVYGGLASRLRLTRVAVSPGRYDPATRHLPYTATLTVAGHTWSYAGAVPLAESADGWKVAFTSDTVYPGLVAGQSLTLARDDAATPVLDRTGRDLATDADLAVNLLGQDEGSGLRRVLADRRAPGPLQLVVQDASSGETVSVVRTWKPAKPAPGVRTTIDLAVQAAAEKALRGVPGTAALVAIDVPTGEVRALANKPTSGVPPALTPYPPGSTFKIITAAAALAAGRSPSSTIACPSSAVIGQRTIRNHERASLGSVTLTTAFAQSCNTAFAALGAQLPAGALQRAATAFGFGADQLLEVASPGGSLPEPSSTAQVVEDAIGQGNVTASPLAMAAVAAAVGAGSWHQPHVLPCPSCASHPIPQAGALRGLMRAVVTSGTGTAAAGVPCGPVYGKTGTAEYGSGPTLPTHAWFVGWQGRTAFAVFAENGSSGGAVAAPAAARFLRALP